VLFAAIAGAQQNPADSIEWIPLCSKCLSPSVSTKSGLGTAKAVAEGKVTLANAKEWCASWEPDNKACPKEQLDSEKGEVYRISANCPAGKLTSHYGTSYSYAGVWDGSDIGEGRAKFHGADGKIVGRDNASNGLGLAAQWELLCLSSEAKKNAGPSSRVAPKVGACSGKKHCDSNKLFSAEVLQVMDSLVGNTRHHLVKMNIRFTNLTDKPLILGYVNYSSSMVDNLRNPYGWRRPGTHDVSVQGIGVVESRSSNAQFALDPGESRNAVFQVIRYNVGRSQLGTSYSYTVTIAELEKLPNRQVRSVKQYSLSFPDLTVGR
jgi:hypothetical protein